jgi:hypothetical protein
VRGGDLLCEGSSSGKLVRDVAVRPRTGRHASEGLDKDLHAFPETQHQVKGGLLLDVVVSKGTTILQLLADKKLTSPRGLWFCRCLRRIILPSKGALIRALVNAHSSQSCSWCLIHFYFTSCDPGTAAMPRGVGS